MTKKKYEDVKPMDVWGVQWHMYAPRERAYVRDHEDEGKIEVWVWGSSSVKVLDEAEFLAKWAPCAEAKPTAHLVPADVA